MILSLIILLIIIACIFLIISLYFRSQTTSDIGPSIKKGISIIFIFLSLGLFFCLSISSFNIEVVHCENQVINATTTGNATTYSNNITCNTETYSDRLLTGVMIMLALLSLIIALFYVFTFWTTE